MKSRNCEPERTQHRPRSHDCRPAATTLAGAARRYTDRTARHGSCSTGTRSPRWLFLATSLACARHIRTTPTRMRRPRRTPSCCARRTAAALRQAEASGATAQFREEARQLRGRGIAMLTDDDPQAPFVADLGPKEATLRRALAAEAPNHYRAALPRPLGPALGGRT